MDLDTFRTVARDVLSQHGEWYGKGSPEKLTKRWELEGASGGSYTGSEARYHGGETEPDFDTLDMLLEKVAPQISFIQYRRLVAELPERREWRENEYYGNWTQYAEKAIDLGQLHAWLAERDLFA